MFPTKLAFLQNKKKICKIAEPLRFTMLSSKCAY